MIFAIFSGFRKNYNQRFLLQKTYPRRISTSVYAGNRMFSIIILFYMSFSCTVLEHIRVFILSKINFSSLYYVHIK